MNAGSKWGYAQYAQFYLKSRGKRLYDNSTRNNDVPQKILEGREYYDSEVIGTSTKSFQPCGILYFAVKPERKSYDSRSMPANDNWEKVRFLWCAQKTKPRYLGESYSYFLAAMVILSSNLKHKSLQTATEQIAVMFLNFFDKASRNSWERLAELSASIPRLSIRWIRKRWLTRLVLQISWSELLG